MQDPFWSPTFPFIKVSESLSARWNLTTLPFHTHEIFAAFLSYELLFSFLAPWASRRISPSVYPQLPRRTQLNWNIRVVSFVQSTFISACALYVIYADRERRSMQWDDRLWAYSGSSGMVQGFAAGYFLWDLSVSLFHYSILGFGSLVHAIAALTITLLGFRPIANYYGLNFILYELSTPFLNIHWFMDKLNMTGGRAQLINGIILIATFGGCRLVWGTYQTISMFRDMWMAWNSLSRKSDCSPFKQWSSGVDPARACLQTYLPVWLVAAYLGSNVMLTVLNFYWYQKMLATIRKRFDSPKPELSNEKTKTT